MNLPPIQELQAFQQVANQLSFSKAAEMLSISPSTLSNLIRSLERRLQTRLFNRTTRSVSLTAQGNKLYIQVSTFLGNLKDAIDELDSDRHNAKGVVRLSVSEVAAPFILDRLGKSFIDKYPDIEIEVSVDNRLIDIVSEGFDAGIRLKSTIPQDMIAIPIFKSFRFVTVASPSYIANYDQPNYPKDLLSHNCIGFKFQSGRRYDWEYAKMGETQIVKTRGTFTTNSANFLLRTAKDGLGIAMVAEPLIKAELASKDLVRILEDWTIDWPDLCLYFPRNRNMPEALRLVIDTLRVH